MNKLLVICGQTATGKTSLGVLLAKKYNGEIVSADSRQVYKGMDIICGKDLPQNSKFKIQNSKFNITNNKLSVGFRDKDGISIWLVDIVEPDYVFNVGEYVKITVQVIEDIWKRNKLPIIVGGSGLYINALTKPYSYIIIPPDKSLRKELEKLTAVELGAHLSKISPERFEKMNQSDRFNPRRLIRAIEIIKHEEKKKSEPQSFFDRINQDNLFIGLIADRKYLHAMIDRRVEQRIVTGAVEEAYTLFQKGLSMELPALTSIGFRILIKYIEKTISISEAIRLWKIAEHSYARNQMIWFKRDDRIIWFDIRVKNYVSQIEQLVEKWYTGENF